MNIKKICFSLLLASSVVIPMELSQDTVLNNVVLKIKELKIDNKKIQEFGYLTKQLLGVCNTVIPAEYKLKLDQKKLSNDIIPTFFSEISNLGISLNGGRINGINSKLNVSQDEINNAYKVNYNDCEYKKDIITISLFLAGLMNQEFNAVYANIFKKDNFEQQVKKAFIRFLSVSKINKNQNQQVAVNQEQQNQQVVVNQEQQISSVQNNLEGFINAVDNLKKTYQNKQEILYLIKQVLKNDVKNKYSYYIYDLILNHDFMKNDAASIIVKMKSASIVQTMESASINDLCEKIQHFFYEAKKFSDEVTCFDDFLGIINKVRSNSAPTISLFSKGSSDDAKQQYANLYNQFVNLKVKKNSEELFLLIKKNIDTMLYDKIDKEFQVVFNNSLLTVFVDFFKDNQK